MIEEKKTKNIILCSDGTGQSGGAGISTNVWRIYDAIDIQYKDKKQLVFYDDGVGTNKNMVLKVMGLVLGYGLSRNIRELYKYTVMHYKPEDKLYLFGFSRGAHTIRLLAELICAFGILNPKSFDNERELDKAIKKLQNQFKAAIRWAWIKNVFVKSANINQKNKRKMTESLLKSKRKVFENKLKFLIKKHNVQTKTPTILKGTFKDVEIEFIGVWDTVSAVGVPIDEMRNNLFFAHHAFVDHKLNPLVQHACHALAIDEKRHTFKPELWDQSSEKDKNRIEQVWFSGVHTNIGGGYPKDQLSLVSLEWMMQKATEYGLVFRKSRKEEVSKKSNYNGTMYDSRSGVAALYRYKPRDIQQLTDKFIPENVRGANIHISAYLRIKDSSANYSPANLPLQPNLFMTNNLSNKAMQAQEALNKAITKIDNKGDRRVIQSETGNIIWWQRWLHLSFILFFLAFLIVGYKLTDLTPNFSADSSIKPIYLLQKLLFKVEELNPLYISKFLIAGYVNHWEIFLLMLFTFIGLMYSRRSLNSHLNNYSNKIWNHPPFDENRVNAKRLKYSLLLTPGLFIANIFRTNTLLNKHIIPFFKKKIIPIVMTLLIFYLIIAGIIYLSGLKFY